MKKNKVKKVKDDFVELKCEYKFEEIRDEDVEDIVGVPRVHSGCFLQTMVRDIEFEVSRKDIKRISKKLKDKFGKRVMVYINELEVE